MSQSENPMKQYMDKEGIRPYASNSPFVEAGIPRQHVGDISLDKRRCKEETLALIYSASNGEVSPSDMIEHWARLDVARAEEFIHHSSQGELVG